MPKPKPPAKKRLARKSDASKPASIATLVDPVLKRRWDDAVRRMNGAAHGASRDSAQKWKAVADVVDAVPPLYLAGGFSTDRDFFDQFLHVDRTTGLRKARVARFASPAEIEAWGDTRIDAALTYLEAKAGAPLRGRLPVALDKLRIPVTVRGQKTLLPLATATRDQLRTATRALLGGHASRIKASPRGRAVQAALVGLGLPDVSVAPHREGFDLRGIPWAAVKKVAQALAKVDLPKG